MKDIALDEYGDIDLSTGDIRFTESIQQAIAIRIRWFRNEWKLGPDLGISYYENVLKKNPNTLLFEDEIMDAIYGVDGVEDVESIDISSNANNRKLVVRYVVSTKEGSVEGRVTIDE